MSSCSPVLLHFQNRRAHAEPIKQFRGPMRETCVRVIRGFRICFVPTDNYRAPFFPAFDHSISVSRSCSLGKETFFGGIITANNQAKFQASFGLIKRSKREDRRKEETEEGEKTITQATSVDFLETAVLIGSS